MIEDCAHARGTFWRGQLSGAAWAYADCGSTLRAALGAKRCSGPGAVLVIAEAFLARHDLTGASTFE